MAASCGTTLTPIVALVGLSALGYAGFTYFNGGCTSCVEPAQSATTLVAAPEATPDELPACCFGGEKALEVVLASTEGECAGKTACEGEKIACTEGAKTECAGKTCDEPAATVITAAAKSECCKGDPNCTGNCTGDCCGACDEKKPAAPAPAGGN